MNGWKQFSTVVEEKRQDPPPSNTKPPQMFGEMFEHGIPPHLNNINNGNQVNSSDVVTALMNGLKTGRDALSDGRFTSAAKRMFFKAVSWQQSRVEENSFCRRCRVKRLSFQRVERYQRLDLTAVPAPNSIILLRDLSFAPCCSDGDGTVALS
ncbi:hypothetical protein SKAU_G00374580 [Synaphobranchus kaupii]|uniref:Uncharacterized protein n=1 Tax=Synaphobranchus kaupii TaxID=118154 RepID=A0A9Q1IG50_SYNKA|nr:hypothetical protein SKAU_G00374580 [Synaphobranchus kaupii]